MGTAADAVIYVPPALANTLAAYAPPWGNLTNATVFVRLVARVSPPEYVLPVDPTIVYVPFDPDQLSVAPVYVAPVTVTMGTGGLTRVAALIGVPC
jgi:hypothetical protein